MIRNHKKLAGISIILFNFLLCIVIFYNIIKNYYPTGDDFSLLVNSTFLFKKISIGSWFSEGYSNYFRVFPEWSNNSYSNFMRPVANFTLLIGSILFGNKYNYYLLINYLIHSLGIFLTYYVARRCLNLNYFASIIAAFIMFFNPAFDIFFQRYPSFGFDGLAAILAGFSLILIIDKRIVYSFIFILLATFTKESAIFTPIAAALVYLMKQYSERKHFSRRDFSIAFLLLSPILIWSSARIYYFEGFGGNYALNLDYSKSILYKIIIGLSKWPLGLPERVEIIESLNLLSKFDLIKLNLFSSACILVNYSFYIIAFYLIFYFIKSKKTIHLNFLLLLPYLFGNLIFIIVLGLDARFGYLFYMFLIPLALYLVIKHDKIYIKTYCMFLISILMLNGLSSIYKNTDDKSITNYIKEKEGSKQLIDLLRNNADTRKIYLINEISSGFSSPDSVRLFAGINADVIKLNSIGGYTHKTFSKVKNSDFKIKMKLLKNKCQLLISIPDRISFVLQGVDCYMMKRQPGNWFQRNQNIKYRFPDEYIDRYSLLTGCPIYNFGNKLFIEIDNFQSGDIILYYDKGYRILKPSYSFM